MALADYQTNNFGALRGLSQQANPFVPGPAGPAQPQQPQMQALGNILGSMGGQPPPQAAAALSGGMGMSAPLAGAAPGPAGPGDPNQQVPGYGAIQAAYRNYLGREAQPDEIMSHLGSNTPGYGHIQHTISSIAGSPEARLFALQRKQSQQAQPPPAGGPMMGSGIPNAGFAGIGQGVPNTGGAGAFGAVNNAAPIPPAQAGGQPPAPAQGMERPPATPVSSLGLTGAPAPQSGAGANPLFNGMNPQLVALFNQFNRNPTGRGSGLTDIGYWNDKMANADPATQQYFLGRLQNDFQGKGPDLGGGFAASQISPIAAYAMNAYPGLLPQGAPPSYTDTVIQGLMQQLALGNSTRPQQA